MKKIDLGRTIGVLANLGVIAGIIFLAVELQQNNRLLNTQTRLAREDVQRRAQDRVLGNMDLISALVKSQQGAPLSPEEEFLLDRYSVSGLTDMSNLFGQVQDGLIDARSLPVERWRNGFSGGGMNPRMRDVWERERNSFQPDFVQWMDENIVDQ